jgi:hypothetical protein
VIWIEDHWLSKPMHRPGESYSDVILRLVELEAQSMAVEPTVLPPVMLVARWIGVVAERLAARPAR